MYYVGKVVVWDVIYSLHYVGILKGKTLVVCVVSFNVLPLIEWLVSPELSKPKGVVLRGSLLFIGGGICILPSYLTLVSLRVFRGRETLKENEFTFSSLGLGNSLI